MQSGEDTDTGQKLNQLAMVQLDNIFWREILKLQNICRCYQNDSVALMALCVNVFQCNAEYI